MKKKMKMITLTALAAISTLSMADTRDAVLGATTNVSNATTRELGKTIDQSMKATDTTGEVLKSLLSKAFRATGDVSHQTAEKILAFSKVSQPIFQFTADGLAAVFEVSKSTTEGTRVISNKIRLLLEPSVAKSSQESTKISSDLLDLSGKTEEKSQMISDYIKKVFGKPLDLSTEATNKILELIGNSSAQSTKLSNAILGKENVEKGVGVTSNGISLTSKGISAIFYAISKGTSAISNLFQEKREEIEKARAEGDEMAMASLRDLIRAEIEKSVDHGETLKDLLSDEDLNRFIDVELLYLNPTKA